MNRVEVLEFLGTVADLYPERFSVTERTASAWSVLLEPYDAKSCSSALLRHARTSQFPPTPADICQPLDEALTGIPPLSEATSVVYELASRDSVPGWDDLPDYVQPMVEAAGGWHAIRNGEMKDLGFCFRRAHSDLVEKTKRANLELPQPSLPESKDEDPVVSRLTDRLTS